MGDNPAVGTEELGSGTQATKKERDAAPPVQKYRWTDGIKALVWQLVNMNNELVSMANVIAFVSYFIVQLHWQIKLPLSDSSEYEPDNHQHVSEQTRRKALYQKAGTFISPHSPPLRFRSDCIRFP